MGLPVHCYLYRKPAFKSFDNKQGSSRIDVHIPNWHGQRVFGLPIVEGHARLHGKDCSVMMHLAYMQYELVVQITQQSTSFPMRLLSLCIMRRMVIHSSRNDFLLLRSNNMDPNVSPQHEQFQFLRTQTRLMALPENHCSAQGPEKTGSRYAAYVRACAGNGACAGYHHLASASVRRLVT